MKDFTYFFNGDTNLSCVMLAKKFQRKNSIEKSVGIFVNVMSDDFRPMT